MNLPSVSVPPNLQQLAAELEAMDERLQARTPRRFSTHAGPHDAERLIAAGPSRIEQAACQLVAIMEGPMAAVANNPYAHKKQVHAAVARLESFIEMLRSEEDRARDLSAQLSYDYGLEMLADCWRELDKQVDAWVQKVVQALTRPQTALSQPGRQVTDGRLMLDMRLLIEPPPSMTKLAKHLQTRQSSKTWSNQLAGGIVGFVIGFLFGRSS